MAGKNTVFLLEDDEYAEKINKIIQKDYFPYQQSLRRQNAALDNLSITPSTVAPEEIDSVLTPTPYEKSKSIDKEILPQNQKDSLTEFVKQNVSKDEESFQKIISKDIDRNRKRYFWLEMSHSIENNSRETLLLKETENSSYPSTKMVKVIDPKGKTHHIPKSSKNRLMFHPDAIPNQKSCTVNSEVICGNTRVKFRVPTSKKQTSNEIKTTHFNLVPSTPEIEPNKGNVSPLMTWGNVDSTPLRIEDEKKSFRMFETPKRDKIHLALTKKISRNLRPKRTANWSGTPMSHQETPGSLGGLSVDKQLRKSYGMTPERTANK